MRTKDIKAGVAYATCDGRYIVPVEPVHAGYRRVWNSETREHEIRAKAPEASDPWGPCIPGSGGNGQGVLADRYEVDSAGRRTGEPQRRIIPPRDIKGTWKAYLALHGERVRKLGEQKAEERRRVKAQEDAVRAVRELLGEEVAAKAYFYPYKDQVRLSIEFRGDSPARAVAALRRVIRQAERSAA